MTAPSISNRNGSSSRQSFPTGQTIAAITLLNDHNGSVILLIHVGPHDNGLFFTIVQYSSQFPVTTGI